MLNFTEEELELLKEIDSIEFDDAECRTGGSGRRY